MVNYVELDLQTLIVRGALLGAYSRIGEQELQTLFQAFAGFHHQKIFGGHITGRKLRQEVLAQTNGYVTAFGNFYTVFQCLWDVGKQLAHLIFATQILLGAVFLWSFRIIESKAIVNGDPNFMGVEIFRRQNTHIVGRHHRQIATRSQFNRKVQVSLFVLTTGTDQLQIVAFREISLVKVDALIHQLLITAQQCLADIAITGAGEHNQPFVVLLQPITLDDWPALHIATLVRLRNQ